MTAPALPFTASDRDALAEELYAAVCALCSDRERARFRAAQLLERAIASQQSEVRQ